MLKRAGPRAGAGGAQDLEGAAGQAPLPIPDDEEDDGKTRDLEEERSSLPTEPPSPAPPPKRSSTYANSFNLLVIYFMIYLHVSRDIIATIYSNPPVSPQIQNQQTDNRIRGHILLRHVDLAGIFEQSAAEELRIRAAALYDVVPIDRGAGDSCFLGLAGQTVRLISVFFQTID